MGIDFSKSDTDSIGIYTKILVGPELEEKMVGMYNIESSYLEDMDIMIRKMADKYSVVDLEKFNKKEDEENI